MSLHLNEIAFQNCKHYLVVTSKKTVLLMKCTLDSLTVAPHITLPDVAFTQLLQERLEHRCKEGDD